MEHFNELLVWENGSDVLDFKFESPDILVWPSIRYAVFSEIIKNKLNLQSLPITGGKLAMIKKLAYIYKTIKNSPFSLKRNFDFLFFSTTTGVCPNVGDKWLGRINDYFVLEYDEQSLVLASSSAYRYNFPCVPKYVKCRDYFGFYPSLRSKMPGKISHDDSKTIKRLVSLLRKSWGNILKEQDYFFLETALGNISRTLIYRRNLYLKLFNRIRPKILFVENASYGGINAWIMKWAKEHGIVTCEFQHGCIGISYMYGEKLLRDKEYKKYLPDYLLLYGKYWSDLVSSPSRKIIIGNPHFSEKKREFDRVVRNNTVKTILIISQWIVTDTMVNLAIQLARMYRGREYKITFRLHSGEIPFEGRYKSLNGISNIQIDKDQDIYKLICDSDYIVGCSSSVLFEAAGLNKKVYVLENDASAAYIPQDIGLRFKEVKDLFDLIKKDAYKPMNNQEILWADGWRENYRNFINQILEGRGVQGC